MKFSRGTASAAAAKRYHQNPWRQWSICFLVLVVAILLRQQLYSNNEYDGNDVTLTLTTTTSSSSSSSITTNHEEQQRHHLQDDCSCEITERPYSFASNFGLEGTVSDCCCSFENMEATNHQTVYPLLQRIVATPFFAHFKIDLCSSCDLWTDAPLCMLRDCGVCECDKPPEWADNVEWRMPTTTINDDCDHMDDRVITTVDDHISESWPVSVSPSFFDDDQAPSRDTDADVVDSAVVVDLRKNPERYTGYAGPSAHKVWSAIHQENCFQQQEGLNDTATNLTGQCSLTAEKRVYNRIISGLHSSISLHIAHSYCLEMDPNQIAECKRWGPNPEVAKERVFDHPDRLENLYVVFAVLLRAVQKAGSAVTAAVPVTDDFFQDSLAEWKDVLLPEISSLAQSCPSTFDESSFFLEEQLRGPSRRGELESRFRQLLQIMSCVGCDRCKLWGTLQTLGIGTALRVLLDDNTPSLSRQEAVALIHTLERFSSALVFARELANEH